MIGQVLIFRAASLVNTPCTSFVSVGSSVLKKHSTYVELTSYSEVPIHWSSTDISGCFIGQHTSTHNVSALLPLGLKSLQNIVLRYVGWSFFVSFSAALGRVTALYCILYIDILRLFFQSGLGWHLPGLSEVPS